MNESVIVLLIAMGAGLLRNIAGWLENAWKDGTIDPYEWGQLGATITSTVLLAIGVHYGLGFDALASAASGMVLNIIVQAFKKKA